MTLQTDGSYSYAVDNTDPLVDALNVGDSLQDSFDYTVVDAQGATSTAQLTITIAGGNDAPVAGADTVATDQDSVIDIDVLTNDNDVDSGNLTVSLPGNTSTGGAAIAVKPDQTVQYDPQGVFDSLPQGESGSDSFGYTVHDNHPTEPGSSNGTVNLNIAGLNDAPQAQADMALTTENAAVTIDVLQNDKDADNNDSKTLISVNVVNPASQGGSATIEDNQVVWNPNLDFDHLKDGESTQVTLQYVMQDSHAAASAASVTITVQGINDRPELNALPEAAIWENPLSIVQTYTNTITGTLVGTDVDGDVLTYGISGGTGGNISPTSGHVEIIKSGNYGGLHLDTVNNNYYFLYDADAIESLAKNEVVTERFTLTVTDTHGAKAEQPFVVTITGADDAPVGPITGVLSNGTEDVVYPISEAKLLEGFTDIDGDNLSIVNLASDQGVFQETATGWNFTPFEHYNGTVTITYQVSDGMGGVSNNITRTFDLASVNDAPVVDTAPDPQSAKALDPFTYTLPANTFIDVDGDNLTLSVTKPDWLNFDPDTQTFSGTPTNAEAGAHIVQVTATDPSGETATTEFTLNVAKNLNGISSAVENTVPSPTGGTTGDGNGDGIPDSQQSNVASIPIPNSTVWATFGAATGVVITDVQNQPILNTPQKMDAPYGAFSFNLENLTPGETVPMSLYLTGNWSNTRGKEWTNADTGDVINGYWKQMPNQNWKNIATAITLEGSKLRIDFTLTDGDWTDKDGLVNGTIVDPGVIGLYNNAPVANNDDVGSVDEDGVLGFTLQGILGNDTDLDDDSLIPTLVVGPAHGTITELADGSFSYTPNTNFHGADSFTYQVNDGTEDSNIATVNIMVNSVNDIPTGSTTGTLADGIEDTVYPVLAATLLQGFSDVDTEDTLSVIGLNSANGTFAATANGWDFTPVQDHNGLVTFIYQVSDGAGGIVDVTRTLNLTPVNDKPIGSPAGTLANGEEDKAYSLYQSDLLMGFSDVDGDALSVTGLTINNGTLGAFNSSTGSWSFTPTKNYNGTVSLTYSITDSHGGYVYGIERSFNLDPVDDVPVAGNDTRGINEDATIILSFADLMSNDKDVDGTATTIISIDKTGTAGNVIINTTNKTITYTADADEFDLLATGNITADSFKYTLQGSTGKTNVATVFMNITGVNDGNSNLLGTVNPETINGTVGEDRIKGNNGNDTLNGLDGSDDLFGENGDDTLNGGNSIDNLFGGNGNDILNGGNGNDWLGGEKGDDTLTGGLGNDVFLFAKSGSNDIITDFANGFDKIQIAADTGKTGFGQLTITGGIDSYGVVYATVNLGSGGQVTLTGVPTSALDATDFIFPS